jgi:protein-tyrosine phosphatase
MLTELHCHILPGIDDGAEDGAMSRELLAGEYADGVLQLALTSHFNSERDKIDVFLKRRRGAWERMVAQLKGTPMAMKMQFRLGAEVYFSPQLCEIDAKKLCISGTPFMLLEFSVRRRPYYLKETLYHLQTLGIVPMIAHVERYPYIMADLTQVYDWVSAGMIVQSNAGSFLRKNKMQKRLLKMVDWDLIQVLASDAHDPARRKPNLAAGMRTVARHLGQATAGRLAANAQAVFNGKQPAVMPHAPQKVLGRWR